MAVGNVRPEKATADAGEPGSSERYRPLPTGTHGLDPALVKRDQRERLQKAIVELIAQKGYRAVRIVDIVRLARVSQPTFYALYTDKQDLFISAHDEIAERAAAAVRQAYDTADARGEGALVALRAFTELAAAEPAAMSLLVLGAFGADPAALESRRDALEALEQRICAGRGIRDGDASGDLSVKAIIGGIREVTAARLREGREAELPALAGELAAWAACYPSRLPDGLAAPAAPPRAETAGEAVQASERARRAEGRLPSGRSEMPRPLIVKSQRERIVDATAAIVAEQGLAALTAPEIARRASVSLQTFYAIYESKHDAFVGAQKVGMHQALLVAVKAYDEHQGDWPRAVAAGLRALIDYLSREPAHAHLSLVDTFAATPTAIEIRNGTVQAFATYLAPGSELAGGRIEVPAIAAEAVAGAIWQILHDYAENDRVAALPEAAPQLTYLALTPFLGPGPAARAACEARPTAHEAQPAAREAQPTARRDSA